MSGIDATCGWPLALWGLVLVPLFLFALIRSRAMLTKSMFLAVTTLRILVVVLIVLALAEARVHWPSDEIAVATVIDNSSSVTAVERNALIKRAEWLDRNNDDVFFVDLTRTVSPETTKSGTTISLAQQVAAAHVLLPRNKVRRIIVATDGHENQTQLLSAVRRAEEDGIQVFVLPMGELPAIDQIAITGIELPRLIRAGETSTIRIQLFAHTAQALSIALSLDSVLLTTLRVSAPAGRSQHSHQVTFREEGIHLLTAQLQPTQDTLAANNMWRSLVRVAPPPRVLIVRSQGQPHPPLAQVIQDSRLQVEILTPAQLPTGASQLNRYHLVLVDELDPSLIDEPRQRAIRQWVEQGGGLITTTGVHAVRSEPATFRDIEPIIPPRAIPESPPMEIILVIDRSGSMGGQRMFMARQAGVAAVQAMRADSRVGLVAFSGSPDTVIPPVEMNHAPWLIGVISSLTSGGGTDIAAALNAASSIMTSDPDYLHHIILLSDGVSSEQSAQWEATALAARGVTISTISLGYNNSLMSSIAAIGRGRYHVAHDPSQLPRLFVREAQYRQAPPHREVDFRPDVSVTMAFLDGVDFSADPELHGYVLAETRPEARTVLRSPDGDPILAHWEVGEGQVASFTSSTSGRWTTHWQTSASYRRLWAQMAWEMLRDRVEEELRMRVDPHPYDDGLRVITVATNDLTHQELPVVDIARGTDRSLVKPLLLTQRGPGLWQVEVELAEGFVSSSAPRDGEDPIAAVGVDNPYPDEFAFFGPEFGALETIAENGGGRVLDSLDLIVSPAEGISALHPLRLPLLLAALILYILSVLCLRLPRSAHHG